MHPIEGIDKVLEIVREVAKNQGHDIDKDEDFKKFIDKVELFKSVQRCAEAMEEKKESSEMREYIVYYENDTYKITAEECEYEEGSRFIRFLKGDMVVGVFYDIQGWEDITDCK